MTDPTSKKVLTMTGTMAWNNYTNSTPWIDIGQLMRESKLVLIQVELRMTEDVYSVLLNHPCTTMWWMKQLLTDNTEIIEGKNRFRFYGKGTENRWDIIPLDLTFEP